MSSFQLANTALVRTKQSLSVGVKFVRRRTTLPLSVSSADVDIVTDAGILEIMATADLKAMARKRGIAGISKMKKDDLVEALSIPLK